LLKGTFHFRQLEAANFDNNIGDITEATAAYGTIAFDGNGNYTITGTSVDNTVSSGAPQVLNVTGTYVIGANGWGYITNPVTSGDFVYGAVGQGIFVGSSTENNVTNTFLAIPAGAVLTNSTFTKSYWAGLIDFPSGSSADLKNALFELTPNGQGTFGTISLNGQAQNQSNPTILQSDIGATYTFGSDGSVALNVPTPSGVSSTNALFSGSKYVSADGNFIVGYTPTGYDVFFGVSALASAPSGSIYSGLYYLSALEDGPSLGNPCGAVDGFYGSLVSDGTTPAPNQIVHERLFGWFCNTIDFETNDYLTFTTPPGNGADLNGYLYAIGDNGQAFVAIGQGGFFSLLSGVHANTFTGSGVFLNPIGVTDAASYAPITASLTPGELVTLVGSGLSSTTQAMEGGQNFPTTLGGVQVLVNGQPAPIYYVSPTQISAILPYELATSGAEIASIQVSNNKVTSNAVTQYTSDALPGIFSQTANGIGYAAALHAATYELVTPTNPAVAGEYLAIYLTGLGTVTPPITDGQIGPTSPLSYADQFSSPYFGLYFDDYNNDAFEPGTITYAGLAPGLAGLYQITVQVPTGVGPGDVYLEVYTDFSDVNQIQVPIGGSSSLARAESALGPVRLHHGPMAPRKRTSVKGSLRNPAIEPNHSPR
jgi:uncharacterized protein (TIGR03437 family)